MNIIKDKSFCGTGLKKLKKAMRCARPFLVWRVSLLFNEFNHPCRGLSFNRCQIDAVA